MKSGRRISIAVGLALTGSVLLRGQLEPWVQHIPSGPAITALFRSVRMPGGAVPGRRPPSETRPALTTLIASAPRDAMLYRLRAREAELAFDFAAAEADWKAHVQNASDSYAARIELADFYHRRMQPRGELAALTAASAANDDPLQPATAQRGWRAFERMAAVIEQDHLGDAIAQPVFRAWVARYSREPAARHKLIAYLVANRQFDAAETEIAAYGRAFSDEFETVKMRADLALERDSANAAIAVYDQAFHPLWPDNLLSGYFKLLEENQQLREFVGRARAALAKDSADLNATARLFRYFLAQQNTQAARRALLEYRIAKESGRQPWTANELEITAQLFERLPDMNEAARLYYALYSVPPAGGPHAEVALYRLANLLLTAPDQPIQFGAGDLGFYKDIATIDPSPGFLNGILSLLLNGTGPRWAYESRNEKAAAYFHRAAAVRLVALLEQRWAQSKYRDPLRAALVSAYGAYGDDEAVIRSGREYLSSFANGAARVPVAMQVSDALARADRTSEEFALYDQLLRELAAKASGVPIGLNPSKPETVNALPLKGLQVLAVGRQVASGNSESSGIQARSVEYVQVLDKYLSRLAALNRGLDALRVYRAEIDRNPNDPGLYQRLAAFLEQNAMGREVEDIYTRAIAKFNDRGWYHKLARWYLRSQQRGALEKISRDAIATFSGADLEQYFSEVAGAVHPDAALYQKLNLYAHERFPEDMVFVHNLLASYGRRETYDAAAAERLLRQYWFYDPELRGMLFERLSQQGRLYPELTELRTANPGLVNGQFDQVLAANSAAVQFVLEAEAWLGHFEAAAGAARSLAVAFPGRKEFTSKAESLYRSLAAYDKSNTAIAVGFAELEQRADPRDRNLLARIGDIFADREMFTQARIYWEKIPALQPDNWEGYLDTATIYWDYYQFDDALRWIAAARKKFGDPMWSAYQAGVIYEGKRDYRSAVKEYVAGALDGDTAAKHRLQRLLDRPQMSALIDRATADAVVADRSWQAVSLRILVFEAQRRRADIEALLLARVQTEMTSAVLNELEETARRLGFDRIQERAAERLVSTTTDPVDKMRLALASARLRESKKDIAGAARIVDGLYREHPVILGVIRGAVDFHVRNKQPNEAIGILLDAAKRARADLAAQFTLESARIATQASQFDRARTLLGELLASDPFRAEYLAAMADTYLQAKDDRGFHDNQLATIQRLKQAPLAPAQRIERIAAIRRSLIPFLDRLKDEAGVVDQYIEVVNSYPEDEALTREAASYAVAHGQAPRLVVFYRKTIANAPLDYRWPIVLGRIETVTEDFPAAIADYERAVQARPDRSDILEAKAILEERLMRFEDALRSYGRLYELTYRNPQWMIKTAELRARLGQKSDAVTALKTAIMGSRSETAAADFAVAERLESWHILPEAAEFAERGAALAGEEFSRDTNSTIVYARIMARARRMDALLSRLARMKNVQQELQAAGKIVAETYTPEEKARLELTMIAQAGRMGRADRDTFLLPLAQFAGMADLEARWRWESMAAQSEAIPIRFVTLQSQRGRYGELGRQLEEYAARYPGQPVEASALAQSAQAFIAEGDVESQLRVMRKALARNSLSGILLDRYLSLLAASRPDELLTVVRENASAEIRNRAVQFAIASERTELAHAAVKARGSAFPPVWNAAYTALAGQYFNDRGPAVDAAFQTALDTRTIGERLKVPFKPDAAISGPVWFYYGARYGEYLASGRGGDAEAWLPASVEDAPANPDAYVALGDTYAEAGQSAKAIAQFDHALELDADRGDAHSRIARLLWAQGQRPEAVARWKSALTTFQRIQSRGVRVPEPFWGRVAATFTDIGQRRAMSELRVEIAQLLADYYKRNREYRFEPMLAAAVRASLASGEGTAWLVELGRAIDDAELVLAVLMRTPGLTEAQRISLQREHVAFYARRAETLFGDDRAYAETWAARSRVRLVSMLLDNGQVKEAATEWSQVAPKHVGDAERGTELRLAARLGTLESVLSRYRSNPEVAASVETLRNATMSLRNDRDEGGARAILEFLYDREIRLSHLSAANFLGLAEVKLQRNETAAAVSLLNRMALIVEDGFDTLVPAAQLLAQYQRTAEAEDFLRRRIRAVPWDSEARLLLARSLPVDSPEGRQILATVADDSQASYRVRVQAGLFEDRPGSAGAAYQVESLIRGAELSSSIPDRLRRWREALAIAPNDERVQLGTLRLAFTQPSFALALAQSHPEILNRAPVQERAVLAESLAAAAERLDDLNVAQNYLGLAIGLRPPDQRDALVAKLNRIAAEYTRRATNAARQPVIRNVVEQGQVVRARIPRSAQ